MQVNPWFAGHGNPDESNTDKQTTPTAADIKAKLDAAKVAAVAIDVKIEQQQDELAALQRDLNASVAAYATGKAKELPSHSAVEGASRMLEALRHARAEQQSQIDSLAGRLTEAEITETIAAGRELVPALQAKAESKLAAFERALIASEMAQAELFAALFDARSGLKQVFSSDALNLQARAARFRIRDAALSVAKRSTLYMGEFETDGNFNAATPQGQSLLAKRELVRDYERDREALKSKLGHAEGELVNELERTPQALITSLA